MKFSKLSQLFLVSSIGLLVATFLTACQIVTVDYVFLAYNSNSDNTTGIETYAVDSESGAMRTVGSNVSLGKDAAVALAATSDYNTCTLPTRQTIPWCTLPSASTGS